MSKYLFDWRERSGALPGKRIFFVGSKPVASNVVHQPSRACGWAARVGKPGGRWGVEVQGFARLSARGSIGRVPSLRCITNHGCYHPPRQGFFIAHPVLDLSTATCVIILLFAFFLSRQTTSHQQSSSQVRPQSKVDSPQTSHGSRVFPWYLSWVAHNCPIAQMTMNDEWK